MADNRISVHDRVRACDYVAWLADELNKAADWLGDQGFETEADKIELAATHAAAGAWLLARPLLREPPPARWQQDGQQPRVN